MDPLRSSVSVAEELEELGEHRRVLVLRHTVDDSPGAGVERTEDVALDVLPRGQHERLVSRFQVRRTYLRIEMNVCLVLVEHLVLGRGLRDEFLYLVQRLAPSSHWNTQPRTRPSTSTAPGSQQLIEVTARQLHLGVGEQLTRQHLQRPVRPVPAVVVWNPIEVAQQALFDLRCHLRRLATAALVVQRRLAELFEPIHGAINRGTYTIYRVGHLRRPEPVMQQQQDPTPRRFDPRSRLAIQPLHTTTLRAGKTNHYAHRRGTSQMSRMCWLHNPFYISWFLFSILPLHHIRLE